MREHVLIDIDDRNGVLLEPRKDGLRLILDTAAGQAGVTLTAATATSLRDALDRWLATLTTKSE
jgi:hypothetical protein